MIPSMEQVVNDLIDGFIDNGTCEFNNHFAMRMPGIIVAEQRGLHRGKAAPFKRWAVAIIGVLYSPIASDEEIRVNAETELEAQTFFTEVFADRKARPQDDLISAMINA